MKTYNNNKLEEYLSKKGISFDRNDHQEFKKNDYYQVVNAYKPLFVSKVEKIEQIVENVNNGVDIDRYKNHFRISSYIDSADLLNKIGDRILEKYGVDSRNKILDEKIKLINSKNYEHHVYKTNSLYKDFLRMNKFEHELRSVLLKYTLQIEKEIKRISIAVLNDSDKGAGFLTDINEYDTSLSNEHGALKSLKKVVEMHENKNSKPILRKRQQNVIVPYWILINEMTLNQTLDTIKNLKPDIKYRVFQKCVNEFTLINVDIFDSSKNQQVIKDEREKISLFVDILEYIGDFRNLLAHNQPIYCYNVAEANLSNFPNICYLKPILKRRKQQNYVQEQHNVNATLMRNMVHFFGADTFSNRNYQVNIDLSWIIYVINKLMKKVDDENNFSDEVKMVFKKYNLILNPTEEILKDYKVLKQLLEEIDNANLLDLSDEMEAIQNKRSYKKNLIRKVINFNKKISDLKKYRKKIKIEKVVSKYKPFTNVQEYKKYTNIDYTFLINLM